MTAAQRTAVLKSKWLALATSDRVQALKNPASAGFFVVDRCEGWYRLGQLNVFAAEAFGQLRCQTVGETVNRQLRIGADAGREDRAIVY